MTETLEKIRLSGGKYYLTHNADDAYKIISGIVFVYIVPLSKGKPGRRNLIYEASAGELIPSLSFTDGEYNSWRFCLTAKDYAELEIIPSGTATPLKNKFAARVGVENYQIQGFESGLVDIYNMNIVKEDGYFIKSKRNKESIAEQTDKMIFSAFSRKKQNSTGYDEKESLYSVISILCDAAKIDVASLDRIKQSCGKTYTIDDIASVSGFPCRDVILENDWYKTDSGYFFVNWGGEKKPAACIPHGNSYSLYDSDGNKLKITKKIASEIDPHAKMIYRPFKTTKLDKRGFIKFCFSELRVSDIIILIIMTLITSGIGILMPILNQNLYDKYAYTGRYDLIIQIGLLISTFTAGNILFTIIKNVSNFRLSSHVKISVKNAVYNRVFELPENFFRNYESADLAQRTMESGEVAGAVVSIVVGIVISFISTIVYLFMMCSYSGLMTLISALAFLIYGSLMVLIYNMRTKYKKKVLEMNGKTNSIMYQLLGGISKVRMAGIEDRALYEYMKPFVKERTTADRINRIEVLSSTINAISSSIIMIFFYWVAQNIDISMGQFAAFTSAFGMAFSSLGSIINNIADISVVIPAYERMAPILETHTEGGADKIYPSQITGEIDIDHVSFSYSTDDPLVLDDISLHISSGEYIGIVGSSGCGKSTLLKLLLGFERPVTGKIYYDSQDMETLDPHELRKQLGVVLQEGKLIAGSIYENITITSSSATMKEVNDVVKRVGLYEDILQMPMGLHTVLSEDCSTISGGQQQRILIARALINKPPILYFDEATSALDNLTQSMVCDTLEKMQCTKVVIAHRLSTIRNCDRIIVLDHGKIAEQGSYEQLMDLKGLFYNLASRQILDKEGDTA